MTEVIQKSSNVGAVKMAMQMQPREMWELYSAVGFGQKPQIGFPGAVTGRLRPYKTWRPIEQATMSYGYGLSASLFQMARAYTVFAHDGELIPVTHARQQRPTPAPSGVRVLSPQTARDGAQDAAAGRRPRRHRAEGADDRLLGRRQDAAPRTSRKARATRARSTAPGSSAWRRSSNPRIIVAVMVDEPSDGKYFGGDVAAPVFSEVVQQTLRMMGVQPDLDVKPQIVARDVPAEEESF